MSWKTLIAVVSAELDQELARQIDFLKAEKKILKQQVKGRIRLNDTVRAITAVSHRPRQRRYANGLRHRSGLSNHFGGVSLTFQRSVFHDDGAGRCVHEPFPDAYLAFDSRWKITKLVCLRTTSPGEACTRPVLNGPMSES